MAFLRTGVIILSLLLGWAALKSPPVAQSIPAQGAPAQASQSGTSANTAFQPHAAS